MAATTTSQSIKTNPSKQDTHVSQASKKAYTINNSVHKIYTDSRDNLSPAAIYNEKRKNGVFSMPSYPTVGVPTNSSDIWQPHKTPEASRAAILAKSKTVSPKQGRESISGSGKNASSAALSAHGVSGRDTAANALPDAYAWGDRTSSITPSSRGADLLGATHATSGSPVNARPGKSKSPSFTSISNTKVPDSNYLQNIGNLQEAARKKADDRLSKLYKSSSIANAGDGAAALAITTSREEELRKAQEREKSTLSVQQHEALMAVARGRAEKKISQIDEDVFYKNPTLNLKYYTAALAVAEEKGKDRMVNHGKIDIGGGKFMSQSDIDAIAERNVRPVINEISEKAQAQRQADEERRQAEEEEKRKRAEEKRLEQEQKIADRKAASDRKAADKAIKNEEKAKSKAEWEAIKTEEREKKAAEKAARDKERNEQKVFLEQKRSEEREAKVLQKSKLKEEKRVFAANRRTEKLALKTAVATTAAAVAQAKQAESLAHAEVQKLNALKLTAETKLEAARLAESHAESEAQAEKARADAALAEAEIAKADAQAKEAEARRIEAEAEKARANAEAEKAKENQRVGEEEAKKQELEFDQREAEINKQTSAKSAQDGEVKPDAELEASTNEVEEKAEKPEDDSEVVANNVVTPLVVVPDVNPPVETETSDKPISIADSVEKKSASDAAPVNTGIDSLAGLAPVIKTVETDATPAKPSEDATAVDTTLAPTDADEPTAEPTAEAAVATSPAESEEKNESLLKKPPTESKNTTSSVVSIKSGAPGTLETPGTNGDVAVTPIAENKDAEHAAAAAADGIPKAIETKAVETKPAEVTPPTSPTGDSIASPSSPTSSTSPKGKAKSFFSKVKSKAKEEFSSLKSSSKKTTTKSSTTTTAAPAAVAPAITEPEKKTGISSKTDASHGGVSAASAARAALGQPTEAAESSAVKTTSSKPPLERTFSGFSQGSAEDEVVETPTAEYKDALANAEDAAAETGSNAEGNKFFFSEDVDSIKGDGAPTSNN